MELLKGICCAESKGWSRTEPEEADTEGYPGEKLSELECGGKQDVRQSCRLI